jgi:hypothetical protein
VNTWIGNAKLEWDAIEKWWVEQCIREASEVLTYDKDQLIHANR